MTRLFTCICIVLLTLLGGCAPDGSSGPGKSAVSAPTILPGTLASIVIGDVQGLINCFGRLGSKDDPQGSAESMRMLGTMIGDTGLAGFRKGAGIALVAIDGERFFIVAEVSAEKMEHYISTLEQFGLVSKAVSGVLVAAPMPDVLSTAETMVPEVKKRFGSASESQIKITGASADYIKSLGPQVNMMLQTFVDMMSATLPAEEGEGMKKIFQIEVFGFLSVAKQIDVFDLILNFADTGVRVDFSFTPVAGSNLAGFLTSCQDPFVESDLDRLPYPGALRGGMAFDGEAISRFMEKEIESLRETITPFPEDMGEWLQMICHASPIYGKQFSTSFILPGQKMASGAMLIKAENPEKIITQVELTMAKFQQGPVAEFYKSMGMEYIMDFARDSREHTGTPIHNLTINVVMTGMPPEEIKAMKELLGDMSYEIAATKDGYIIMCTDSELVDGIIDGTAAGASKPLMAKKVFGTDGVFYFDLGMSEMMNVIYPVFLGGVPDMLRADLEKHKNLFEGVPPITMAGFTKPDVFMCGFHVPIELIHRITELTEGP